MAAKIVQIQKIF